MGQARRQISHCEALEVRWHLSSDGDGDPVIVNALAVNAGGPAYTDSVGDTWDADRNFANTSTQKLLHNNAAIANTTLDPLFNTAREDFTIHFGSAIPNGTYSVKLYFVEQEVTSAGARTFNIELEKKTVASNFDVFKTAGGQNKALIETYTATVSDGHLDVDLIGGKDKAILSAIAVAPTNSTPTPTPTSQSLTWVTKASDPQKREEAESWVSGNKLYVYGGYINNAYQASTRLDVYNPATNTWKRLNNGPSKVTHAGVTIDPKTGIVWVCGGFVGDMPNWFGTANVWKYDPKTDTWTKGPSLPASRGSGGAAIINNKLYFFDGATGDRKSDSSQGWSLDLSNTSAGWKSIAASIKPRNHFSYAAVNGKIYTLGGQTHLQAASVMTTECEMYDPSTNTWSELPPLPEPYSHFSFTTSVYKNRYIFIAGGENPHNGAKAEVKAFDTVTHKWLSFTSLPQARRAAAGGIINNHYIVTSGYIISQGLTSNTWVADLSKLILA